MARAWCWRATSRSFLISSGDRTFFSSSSTGTIDASVASFFRSVARLFEARFFWPEESLLDRDDENKFVRDRY